MTRKGKALLTLYKISRITTNGLKKAVQDGTITESEYTEITGEAYNEQ